ncbi:cytochrome P450 81Q32-like [Silene latifolia]|uniref:cytochrome P450 81Q32-like n=1 Tax=Silene latifolia TaxID=37657 RepID=UPI003D77253B
MFQTKAMINLFLYGIPCFLALYVIITFFIHKLKNLPPTPFLCFPIIGHFYLLKKPLHRTLANLSEAYGPTFYLRLGPWSVVVVSSQSAARECLRQNDIFPDNPQILASKFIGPYNAKVFSALPYGQQWRTLRRILMSDLIYSGCPHLFLTARQEEMKSLIRRLYRQSIQSSDDRGNNNVSNGGVVEVKGVFYELTYMIIMRVVVGEEWCNGENGKRLERVLKEMVKVGKSTNVVANYVPILSKFGQERYLRKKFVRLHGELDRILQDLIDEQRSKLMNNEYEKDSRETSNCNKTLIQVMLSLQLKDPVLYSDRIIKDFVLVLLVTGPDACSTTIEWVLSLLLNNQRVLHKAQAEIDNQVGPNRLIDEPDRLPYLECIIKETLRMYPASPLLVPHEATKGCIVEGRFRVPPGTLLFINMWAIHNNPEYWDEPRKFKPERFEEGSQENMAGYKFMDFWSRNSQSSVDIMAIRSVGLIIGSLIQCFELETNGEKMVDMEEGVLLTTTKVKPLEATLRPRPTMLNLLSHI